MTTCIECGEAVSTPADVEIGEILDCTGCGTELEVVDVEPVTVEQAPELQEDWGE